MYVAVYSQGYGDGPEHDGVFGPFTNEEKGKVWVRSYLNNVVGWDGLDQAPDFDWESTDLPFTYGGWFVTEVIFVDEDADLGVDFPFTVDPEAPYATKTPYVDGDDYSKVANELNPLAPLDVNGDAVVDKFVAWLNQSGLLGPDVRISIDMVDEYVLATIEDRGLVRREAAIDEIVDTYESNFQEDDAYDLG